jgi:carbon storage regulator CsrA
MRVGGSSALGGNAGVYKLPVASEDTRAVAVFLTTTSRRIKAVLILSRKVNEQIKIGPDITVTIIEIKGRYVRLGIEAPPEVRILRAELLPEEKTDDLL